MELLTSYNFVCLQPTKTRAELSDSHEYLEKLFNEYHPLSYKPHVRIKTNDNYGKGCRG